MPLIIIKDRKELPQDKISDFLIFNDSGKEIQYEYCFAIEFENQDKRPFLTNPDIKEYLEKIGIHYKGNYIFEGDDWGNSYWGREQFVTAINHTIQFGCLALHNRHKEILMKGMYYFEARYMIPVLEKRDIYLLLQSKDYHRVGELEDVLESGIEVRIAGKSSKYFEENMFLDFLWENVQELI
ncbi:MAG: hypothetical protein J6A75_02290 [Lachnospiraceae bacterium]|nr:hypothetical protein [Lachnospiraceae bacterium]